jgi:hypothetical protein
MLTVTDPTEQSLLEVDAPVVPMLQLVLLPVPGVNVPWA